MSFPSPPSLFSSRPSDAYIPISYDSLGEFDRAIADYTHALELDMAANAKTGGAQRQRGSGGLVE
jgi:hypothetical protein